MDLKKIVLTLVSIIFAIIGFLFLLPAFAMIFGAGIDLSPPGSELGGIIVLVISIIFLAIAWFSWKKK